MSEISELENDKKEITEFLEQIGYENVPEIIEQAIILQRIFKMTRINLEKIKKEYGLQLEGNRKLEYLKLIENKVNEELKNEKH